ncbi:MAG TPA: hypothetical protein VMT69_18290 [Kineosporiaceae bacterium]|nr:hypothetical protein [Kineosporiaceae bacterium]
MTAAGRGLGSTAALHLVGAVAVPACLVAAVIELRRAASGNGLSWAYVVEWPVIAGYGVYLWVRLTRERRAVGAAGGVSAAGPPHSREPRQASEEDEPDAELLAWRAYLAELHAQDPPGGPGLTR